MTFELRTFTFPLFAFFLYFLICGCLNADFTIHIPLWKEAMHEHILRTIFLVQFSKYFWCNFNNVRWLVVSGWWCIRHIGLSRLMTGDYCLWFVTNVILRHGDHYDENEDDNLMIIMIRGERIVYSGPNMYTNIIRVHDFDRIQI